MASVNPKLWEELKKNDGEISQDGLFLLYMQKKMRLSASMPLSARQGGASVIITGASRGRGL